MLTGSGSDGKALTGIDRHAGTQAAAQPRPATAIGVRHHTFACEPAP